MSLAGGWRADKVSESVLKRSGAGFGGGHDRRSRKGKSWPNSMEELPSTNQQWLSILFTSGHGQCLCKLWPVPGPAGCLRFTAEHCHQGTHWSAVASRQGQPGMFLPAWGSGTDLEGFWIGKRVLRLLYQPSQSSVLVGPKFSNCTFSRPHLIGSDNPFQTCLKS